MHRYDELRNICNSDNNGELTATIIVAGLPGSKVKTIDAQFKQSAGIGSGMNRSARPSFMNRKKATVTSDNSEGGKATRKFNWK